MKSLGDQFQTIIDAIPLLAWAAAADGSAESFNQRWLDYSGLSIGNARNTGWMVTIHPDDLTRLGDYWQAILRSGEPGETDARIRRFDGVYRWFLFRATPSRDEDGNIIRWFGTYADIEDRKRSEGLLDVAERSAGQLRSILDTIPTLAWSMRPDGSIDYFNQQWAEYTGMPVEQALNWGWKAAKHSGDMPRILQAFERATESGEPVEVEGRIRRRDGVFRWFLIRANPLRDQSGAIVRWYGTDVDIEDRKFAETELAKAFEEIKRLRDRLEDENVVLREQIDRTLMFEEIVGASPALKAAVSAVTRVAPTDSTVLLLGETGTGKELFARAIHKRSPRSHRAFVSVNCAAIPQALIASELFGHERGSFTGAQQRRLGRFEIADGGTLFLDEIGDLPLDTQIALLRVLQERQFERVGGTQPITADVRVIAATNRNLRSAIMAGTFRSDLFYRLNVFPIEIPPLRQRREDIPLLVEYFIDRHARKAGKEISGIDRKSMDLLRGYSWPGNVREVQNLIERAVIVCDSRNLEIDKSWLSRPATPDVDGKPLDPFKRISQQEQKAIIEAALRESGGRVYGSSGAAARLGIPRSTLESKIRSLGINKHFFKAGASLGETA